MKKGFIASIVALSMAGCQHTPNTQGAGYGETYTPVVDMQGVDMSRYDADLDACRANAKKVDASGQAMAGMIAGMLVGAAVGAAVGGRGSYAETGAMYGGGAGLGHSANKAAVKQETIIANCLAGRGYRVLEGATIPPKPYVASPYGPVSPAAPARAPAVAYMPSPPVAQSQPSKGKIGPNSFNVEALARQESCSATPVAYLAAAGPGYDNYSVACTNGDTVMYRCEFGNCRALR
jgi:outer membrane lipoprotein SlyB